MLSASRTHGRLLSWLIVCHLTIISRMNFAIKCENFSQIFLELAQGTQVSSKPRRSMNDLLSSLLYFLRFILSKRGFVRVVVFSKFRRLEYHTGRGFI
jgi:hypothetical protein